MQWNLIQEHVLKLYVNVVNFCSHPIRCSCVGDLNPGPVLVTDKIYLQYPPQLRFCLKCKLFLELNMANNKVLFHCKSFEGTPNTGSVEEQAKTKKKQEIFR